MIQTIRVQSENDDRTKIYRLEGITKKQAKVLAENLLAESVNQTYSINKAKRGNSKTEIAYKPGVMNPEVESIIKAAKDLKINLKAADSSWEYSKSNGEFNSLVQYKVEKPPKTLLIEGKLGPTSIIKIRNMNGNELLELSKDKLFLNLEEMKVIQNYFIKIKRDPTDCELETLAQTWSEHCAHKTFKAKLVVDGKVKESLIKRIKKEALRHKKDIVSAFVDNSGVMNFYDGMAICAKVETHNSPSAIEPYGGAETGSGGVFRDVLGTGQGAKVIASTDIFCFAPPDLPKKELPVGCLPPKYLLKRVVEGVRDYGNRVGIPTNNGSIHFHDDFRAKPTVIVGGYGIIPKKKAQKGIVKKNDLVVAIGGRTGRDGIHGATFSSGEMTERTITVNGPAVQIGNAIEEKRVIDAVLEGSDRGLIRAITDCGAGGFSSAIGEMGQRVGVKVDLSKAPLKYNGLAPWEIWVSESQERMVLAIPKNKIKRFIEVCRKYNVESSILGKFDGSKKLLVYYGKKLVCDLSMEFLHHGLPQRKMTAKKPKASVQTKSKKLKLQTERQWIKALSSVLSDLNVCSKEPIVRLYDHTVQGANVLQSYIGEKLDGPADAAVIRPILSKNYGMVISHGLNPALNNIDPYWGSIWAGVEALSNYVAVGGDYRNASLINNYIWPFPDEESLWSLDRSVEAVLTLMKTFKIPVISGKDSLSSTYRGKDGKVIKIPPVLCISVFGKIPDVSKTVSSDFKKVGSSIYLLGKQDFSDVPKADLKSMPKLFNALFGGINGGKILSVHDISEGGAVTSIFEMCVGGGMGAKIDVRTKDIQSFLFNETAGTFLVEIENEKIAKKLFKGVRYLKLGETVHSRTIKVRVGNKKLFEVEVEKLKKVWQEPMKKIFR